MPEVGAGGLRRRLAVALVGFTVAAAALQGLGFWVAERWVERVSLERLLERELVRRIETNAPPTTAAANDSMLRYFRAAQQPSLPAVLTALPPGWHRRVALDGKDYQALVRDVGPGDRVYLLHDVTALEARERRLILMFGVGLLMVAALALWASRRLAARALAPLDTLVGDIRALNPEARGARVNVDGDSELRVIAIALNGYMAELDALVERERAFAAAASHELRTPLTVIAGAVELLAATPPEPMRLVARIERAVTQARFDLDALLALSRIREAPQARDLALDALLPEWAAPHLVAPVAAVVWQLTPQRLSAPPGSVHIVFSNLLRNALRAAGPAGEVVVDLDANRISVSDNGPGIPLAELPQVFEPHFRGRDGGTGIGLYVARALAQRQGWRLTLVNRDGGGARAELLF